MARSARPETTPNARAKIFTNGRSQAVGLPRQFRFEGKEVAIEMFKSHYRTDKFKFYINQVK